MSPTGALLTGLAQLLHDAGVGVWDPDGVYGSGVVAITLRAMPSQPDRAITLATYDLDHDPTLSDSVIGVQARIRGAREDPTSDSDIDDAIFDVLHGLWDVDLVGGVHVVEAQRKSGTSLGPDGNSRFERTSNYWLTIHRPSPNRT